MKRRWSYAVAFILAAAVVSGASIFGGSSVRAAGNKIVVDYNTSIGTGNPELFGGSGTPSKTQSKAWEALAGTMGIKVVKVPVDLARLFPQNADTMDTDVFNDYAHVAGSILSRVDGAGMTAMLEFDKLPSWLSGGQGMYNDKAKYVQIIKKFLEDVKGQYETKISHVEVAPPSGLSESDFQDYYFTTAQAVRDVLPNVTIGGMGYQLQGKDDTLSQNVKSTLKESQKKDESLLQFVSVKAYDADPTNDSKDYFGEFKKGRAEIRKALNNRDVPLYMTGWSTSAADAQKADSKVSGAEGIKYHASALFKAMRDGWDMVLFDGTVSSDDKPGSYTYQLDKDGNVTINPFVKVYDLLANRLALNKGDFKVVSTDMGSSWPVDDSIAMVNSDGAPEMLLMNFSSAKSNLNVELKNIPYADGKVTLKTYIASADKDSSKAFSTIEANVVNGILSAQIPSVPENCAMGIVVSGEHKKDLPAQTIYEFESQDNHFGGNTQITWSTLASFNRVVEGFGGADNFVTLSKVAADGSGIYTAHLYADAKNSKIKVSVNGGEPILVDGSSVSLATPVSFEVPLNAGKQNTLKFYTDSGELRPDRLVLEAKDVQLSIGIQNLDELAKEGDNYVLPLSKKDFRADARVFPEASSGGKTIVFESSDSSVVSVAKDGTLTPNKSGSCTITAAIQGTEVSTSFSLIVKNSPASVSISPFALTLKKGQTAELTAKVTPTDADNTDVTWTSSDESVVKLVSQSKDKATVEALVDSGTAVITAKTVDGGKNANCAVTITQPVPGGTVSVDFGDTVAAGDPKIFGVTHYPSIDPNDSDIGDHSKVWPMLTEQAGVKFMRADARLQEILPVWTKEPDTNWAKPSGQNPDQPDYVKSQYYYVTGPDGQKRKFSLEGYQQDMEYNKAHPGEYLNGMSNPDNWNTDRLFRWVDAAKAQGYEVMVMTFQIPEWLSSGEVVGSDPHTKKVCNGAPKDWGVYRDIIKKLYTLLRAKGIDYYEFLNEPHWYIPTHGDQRDPDGKPYTSDIVNSIAADQFYQAIDAVYEAEAEITGNPDAKPIVKLGGGSDDTWGGDYGVLGTLFSKKYEKWFDRVQFVSIHKYGDRPANADDSNDSGGNSRDLRYFLRRKTGREMPVFLNEYNVSTGQPTAETYGNKSVGWHAKNLIDMMTDGYSGGGYYTAYPADVPMDDYEASSGWIEKGKGIYTWNNGDPYLANFTKTWNLMSLKLGLGKGEFKVKSAQIQGNMSQAAGAVNADGNAAVLINNYSGQAYDDIKVKLKSVPYAPGTQITASVYGITYDSDINAAPAEVSTTVDEQGNAEITVPSINAWGVVGIALNGTQNAHADKTYEFESYQNTFNGTAKIEKSGKAYNGRWVQNADSEKNAVMIPLSSDNGGASLLDIYYVSDKDSKLTYVIDGAKKEVDLPASQTGRVSLKENLKPGVNDITFYTADKSVKLDKTVVTGLDKSALQELVDRQYTKDGYTDKSWDAYEKAKEAAIAVLQDQSVSADAVEKAYKDLSKAIEGLELMVDLPALTSQAAEKKPGEYTTESWTAFDWSLKCAKAVQDDNKSTQEEQINAYRDLEAAMNKLVKVHSDLTASLIQGNLPVSNVNVTRPEKATDGNTDNSDADENSFTQLEAGPETGGGDNGYSNWQNVYLQYDLGAEYLINELDLYRTYYATGGPIVWKDCKVEVSDSPTFSDGGAQASDSAQASNNAQLSDNAQVSDNAQISDNAQADDNAQAEDNLQAGYKVLFSGDYTTEAQQSTPQKLTLTEPVKARYVRISGRGHQGSWGGYSNKVNFSEIQVFGSYVPDRSYLNDLTSKAEGLKESDYTASSWKTLTEKLSAVKQLGGDAALEQINMASADLYGAMQSMVKRADTAALESAMQKLQDMMKDEAFDKLSTQEKEPYTKLISDAQAMLNIGESTPEEIKAMADQLEQAVNTLKGVYEKTEAKETLLNKIKEAEALDLTGYTKESVKALKDTIIDAKEILSLDTAETDQYWNAYNAIVQAVSGLVKDNGGSGGTGGQGGSGGQGGTGGQGGSGGSGGQGGTGGQGGSGSTGGSGGQGSTGGQGGSGGQGGTGGQSGSGSQGNTGGGVTVNKLPGKQTGSKNETVKTGDTADITLIIVFILISAAGVAGAIWMRRKTLKRAANVHSGGNNQKDK